MSGPAPTPAGDGPFPDIPGQRLLAAPPGGLRVLISAAADGWDRPAASEARIDAAWERARAANPCLRDGPVLSAHAIDAHAGVVHAARSTFRRLVAQGPDLDLGVRTLGVKGLIIGRDAAGAEHVLIARRGHGTRVYGGLWEIAPAGGVCVPPLSVSELHEAALRDTLADEAHEELGLNLDTAAARPLAIVQDEIARSVDLIMRLDWPGGVIDPRAGVCGPGRSDWEYVEVAWLSRAHAAAFDARAAHDIVGPMRIVLRWLGWT